MDHKEIFSFGLFLASDIFEALNYTQFLVYYHFATCYHVYNLYTIFSLFTNFSLGSGEEMILKQAFLPLLLSPVQPPYKKKLIAWIAYSSCSCYGMVELFLESFISQNYLFITSSTSCHLFSGWFKSITKVSTEYQRKLYKYDSRVFRGEKILFSYINIPIYYSENCYQGTR